MSFTNFKERIKGKFRGTVLLSFVLSLTNKHKQSAKPDVFIFSMPRSGSTWLMEIIWSQSGFKYINEPLDLSFDWICKYSGISGFHEYYENDTSRKLNRYIRSFSEGTSGFLNPSPFRKHHKFYTNRVVFKIIHAADFYVNDILGSVNSKGVYLIRHPFDVTLSRRKISKVKELQTERVYSFFNNSQLELIKNVLENGSHLEKGVMTWCIHNKIALSLMSENVLVIFYEDLVLNYSKVSKALYNHCELDNYKDMLKFEKKLSAVSVQSNEESLDLLKSGTRAGLVYKWRSKISDLEASGLNELMTEMGMNIYQSKDDSIDLDHTLLKGKRIA